MKWLAERAAGGEPQFPKTTFRTVSSYPVSGMSHIRISDVPRT